MDLQNSPAGPMRALAEAAAGAPQVTGDLNPFPDVGYIPPARQELQWQDPAPAAIWAKPPPEVHSHREHRIPLGIRSLDEHLGGGIPAGSTVLVVGPPFSGKRALACHFLASSVADGAPALVVLSDGDVAQWRGAVATLTARIPEERKGLACFLDLFGGVGSGRPAEALTNPELVLHAVSNACDALPSDRRLFVMDSFSTISALSGYTLALSMLMRLTAHLRREGATSLILLEGGAHSPMELQLAKRQADGCIEFRQATGVPEAQVVGLGLPAPSPWLQCRADAHVAKVAPRVM